MVEGERCHMYYKKGRKDNCVNVQINNKLMDFFEKTNTFARYLYIGKKQWKELKKSVYFDYSCVKVFFNPKLRSTTLYGQINNVFNSKGIRLE